MKRAFLIIGFLLSALFLAGCKSENASASPTNRSTKTIEAVINQMNAVQVEWTNSMNVLMKDPIGTGLSHKLGDSVQKYHDDLVAIDISGCPDDFRLAFVKYYQAVWNFKTYADSITGWNGVLKGVVNCVGSLLSLHGNTDKAIQPLIEAGNELELICTKYHVELK